jgi:hypothetical protein
MPTPRAKTHQKLTNGTKPRQQPTTGDKTRSPQPPKGEPVLVSEGRRQ